MVQLGHRITEAVGLFDYKMLNTTEISFYVANTWNRSIVLWNHDIVFISEYFPNYIYIYSNIWK